MFGVERDGWVGCCVRGSPKCCTEEVLFCYVCICLFQFCFFLVFFFL